MPALERMRRVLTGRDARLTMGALYDLARVDVLRGDSEMALDHLRLAVDSGFTYASV